MALKSVKSIILNSLIMFRQKLLSDTPVENDYKHALSLAGAYNLKQSIFPVGSIYLSIKNTNPGTFFGGTWDLLPANYVLKTITSGYGGINSKAGNTGGPNDNTSGGPSNNTSGSTTLTAAQSGMPAHNLDTMKGRYVNIGAGSYVGTWFGDSGSAVSINVSKGVNASQGHTHTLSNHTHSLKNHTHPAGMPANISVYAWTRVA